MAAMIGYNSSKLMKLWKSYNWITFVYGRTSRYIIVVEYWSDENSTIECGRWLRQNVREHMEDKLRQNVTTIKMLLYVYKIICYNHVHTK